MVFDFDQIQPDIDKDFLRQRYTDDQLYTFYCPEFMIGDIHSPFRHENTPSFGFFQGKTDTSNVFWKDSKTGETGDVFSFIMRVAKNRGFKGNYYDLYRMIHSDLQSGKVPEKLILTGSEERKPVGPRRKLSIIDVVETKERDIPKVFMPFWEKVGINRNILDAYNVGFADSVWLTKIENGEEKKKFRWGVSTNQSPIFYYYFPLSGHFKIYRPYELIRLRKWLSNTRNETDVQGYHQCNIKVRKPSLLVLTKSMKDVMFLRSLGVDAMALHGEGHNVSKAFIDHLKRHCSLIISIYDNDLPGIRGGIYLRDKFQIPLYFIPRYYQSKDCTDLYSHDYKACFLLAEVLNEILKNEHNYRYTGPGSQLVA
jgi:hypothetical protein